MTTAIVVKGYPRLSEPFIAQEIAALEAAGLNATIVSLRLPTDKDRHPVHTTIRAPVLYLPEYLWRAPGRVLRGWLAARRLPGYAAARAQWVRDLARDPSPNRIRRFGQALVLAAELRETVDRLYAHFLHTPSSVARYAALMRGLPWSASAHAVDIWTTPDWELREKLADAAWVVTCTANNAETLKALAPDPERVRLVYHGLDLRRFPPAPERQPGATVTILSVGRAVEKKGYPDLLAALARLPGDLDWRLVHVGGGPLAQALKREAERLGIAGHIDWRGPLPQDAVLEEYRRADLFALACKRAGNGDMDGLPNVLMEAQSQGLPVVSTRLSAIPELVLDGETGLLAEPGDAAGLAAHLERLIRDPELRRRLGDAGAQRVRERFDFAVCVAGVIERFGLTAPERTSRVA